MTSGALTAAVRVTGADAATGDRFTNSISSDADHRRVEPGRSSDDIQANESLVPDRQIECLYGGPTAARQRGHPAEHGAKFRRALNGRQQTHGHALRLVSRPIRSEEHT